MAYTRQQFALELKEKIQNKETIESISEWALHLYRTYHAEIDYDFCDLLSDFHSMDINYDHIFSLQELNDFADRLLAGELILDPYNKRNLRMQLRKNFGLQLKEKVQKREDVALIGQWAYLVYSEYLADIDNDFSDFLLSLSNLENGPEFALSYEELDQTADRLIAGERVIKLYEVADNPVYKNR